MAHKIGVSGSWGSQHCSRLHETFFFHSFHNNLFFFISYLVWAFNRSTIQARRLRVSVVVMFCDEAKSVVVVKIRALAGLGPFSLSLGSYGFRFRKAFGWLAWTVYFFFILLSRKGGGTAQPAHRRHYPHTPAVVTTHPVPLKVMGTTHQISFSHQRGAVFLSSFSTVSLERKAENRTISSLPFHYFFVRA